MPEQLFPAFAMLRVDPEWIQEKPPPPFGAQFEMTTEYYCRRCMADSTSMVYPHEFRSHVCEDLS